MNRRSFIAKAVAGIAAIPLLNRLVQAEPKASNPDAHFLPRGTVLGGGPPRYYAALIEHTESGLNEVSAKGYHRVPIQNIGDSLYFPIAEEDWGYVTHIAFAESPTGPISRLFDLHSWSRRTIRAGQSTCLDLEII
jgi:hypothetical protein